MAEDLYSSPPSHFVQENVSLHKQLPSYSYSPTVPTVEGKRSPWVQERDAKGHVLYFNTLTGERHPAEPTDWLLKEFHQGYELYVNSYTNDYFWKPEERKRVSALSSSLPDEVLTQQLPLYRGSKQGVKKASRHYPAYTEKEEKRRKRKQPSSIGTGTTACAPRYSYTAFSRRPFRQSRVPDLSSGEDADDERGDLGMSLDTGNISHSWFSSSGAKFLLSFLLSEPESGASASDEELGGCYTGESGLLHGFEDEGEYFDGLPFKERMKWLSSQMVSLSSDASEAAKGIATHLFRAISSRSGCSTRHRGRGRTNSAPESPTETHISGNIYKPLLRRTKSNNTGYKQEFNGALNDSPRLSSVPFLPSHGNESDPGSLSVHSESSFVVPPPELADEGQLKSPSGKDLPVYDFNKHLFEDCSVTRNLQSELASA
eukprot:gb/GECG01003719.1/.p1 GENE.gb/GECG01003719.1/~~gb/GECG01003719.1/.p1  ORF type:complete len:430 (+),score=48.68 gb/GECG01003719.1/:1-1290(+)